MKTKFAIFVLAIGLTIYPSAAWAQRRGPSSPTGPSNFNPGRQGGPGRSASNTDNFPGTQDDSNPPPNSQSNSSPANSSNNSNNSNDQVGQRENDSVWTIAERILNSNSLGADTENGIFTYRGIKFDVANNLVVRSRFERYLSAPGYAATNQDYQSILQQISTLLTVDPNSPATGDKVYQAWTQLFTAAKFEQDGGASLTLANQVYNAWRMRDEMQQSQTTRSDLERQRKNQESIVINSTESTTGDILEIAQQNSKSTLDKISNASKAAGQSGATAAQGAAQTASGARGSTKSDSGSSVSLGSSGPSGTFDVNSLMPGSGSGDSSSAPKNVPNMAGSTRAAFNSMDLARTYAKENLLDVQNGVTGLQAKLQYQTQLITFLFERRFQHSLLAGQFYEHIFKGSQQRINVGEQELSKFMNIDNVVPSVNSFEFVSQEAIADTNSSMKSVETAYDAGERWTALQQLQQAFVLGEMLPSVQNFDPAKRHVLWNIYHASNDLKHMIDLRDFANAEKAVKKIELDATDFDAASIVSAIQSGKQTSNLALMAAEQAALAGDSDSLKQNLEKAIELWPLNPEIDSFSKAYRDKANITSSGVPKFDDLLARGDERQIYELRTDLGLAVYQDPDRAAKFKEVVNRVGQVEMMIAYADQALQQGNGYAAWDALLSASKIEPSDPVLAVARANTAPRVADYASALDSATRAEKSGEYAASLNYYLKAQDIYPASQLSGNGIKTASMELMAQLNPSGPSARQLAADRAAQDSASQAETSTSNSATSSSSKTPANNTRSGTASANATGGKSLF